MRLSETNNLLYSVIKDLCPFTVTTLFIGGGERVRTDGLLRARQVLSQLSYTPSSGWLSMVGLDGLEPSTSRLSGVRSNRN
jgi:hypothetical protein